MSGSSKSSLWLMKAHYFLWNAGIAPVTPFLSIYAKHLGFTSVLAGAMFTVLSITGMLAKPAFGAIADRFKCQKKIFLTLIAANIVLFMCILQVLEYDKGVVLRFSCDGGRYALDSCRDGHDLDAQALLKVVGQAPNGTTQCKVLCKTVHNIENNLAQETNPLVFTARIDFNATFEANCTHLKILSLILSDGTSKESSCMSKEVLSADCTATCHSPFVYKLMPKSSDDRNLKYIFAVYFALMVLAWFTRAVVVSTSDAICFELLGDERNKYGQQRCFGALGWGLLGLVSGLILDTGNEGRKNYSTGFYLSAAILLLDFVVSLNLKYEQKRTSRYIFKDVVRLLSDTRTVIFSLWCVFMGANTGVIWNFLFWLIEELGPEKSWLKTLQGAVMAAQSLGGELPFFFVSGRIFDRIGHANTMSLILFAMGIRATLYSVVSNPWWVLPVELLSGITFGLYYACMASYASLIARPGTETTVQGSAGALSEIGISLGSFLGGLLFHKYGGSITFRYLGIASFVACFLHVFAIRLHRKWDKGEYAATRTTEEEKVME